MSSDKFRRELRAGERLFHEGDPGDCAYLVEAGVIDVKRKKDSALIGTVRPGDLLGELALLDGRPRSAGAVAREASSVRIITREHLRERLQQSDPLLRHLLHLILERYRAAMGVSGDSGLTPDQDVLQADREDALQRLRRVQELEGALERKELVLRYQPVVNLQEGTTAGFEARVHRQDQDGADIGSAVQESALAADIGRWVLLDAAGALRRMAEAAQLPQPLFLAVTVAGRHLADPAFVQDVTGALKDTGLAPVQLMLNVTEAHLLRDASAATRVLASLRADGVRIAGADFGMGQSSLSKLHSLPLDALKLHRSFVAGLQPGGRGAEILKVMAALAHALRVPVIVDGVENPAQAQFLKRYGFEYALGEVYSPQVPETEATGLASKKWE